MRMRIAIILGLGLLGMAADARADMFGHVQNQASALFARQQGGNVITGVLANIHNTPDGGYDDSVWIGVQGNGWLIQPILHKGGDWDCRGPDNNKWYIRNYLYYDGVPSIPAPPFPQPHPNPDMDFLNPIHCDGGFEVPPGSTVAMFLTLETVNQVFYNNKHYDSWVSEVSVNNGPILKKHFLVPNENDTFGLVTQEWLQHPCDTTPAVTVSNLMVWETPYGTQPSGSASVYDLFTAAAAVVNADATDLVTCPFRSVFTSPPGQDFETNGVYFTLALLRDGADGDADAGRSARRAR